MLALDRRHRRARPVSGAQKAPPWLRWICDLTVGTLTLVAFLAVAFAALYLRARLGMPGS